MSYYNLLISDMPATFKFLHNLKVNDASKFLYNSKINILLLGENNFYAIKSAT